MTGPEEETHLTALAGSDEKGPFPPFPVRTLFTSEDLIHQSRLPFLLWPFRIRATAVMVFQFRVVAGTPNSLSIWPR